MDLENFISPRSLADQLTAARGNFRPMVLIASLPRNDPQLAQAALDNGADVIKLHINLRHHASGTHFGALEEEQADQDAQRDWQHIGLEGRRRHLQGPRCRCD